MFFFSMYNHGRYCKFSTSRCMKNEYICFFQKLLNISESVSNQDKSASLSDSDSSKHMLQNGESTEHLDNLKEQIASQSQEIEMMSQHQTLLHELRGQVGCTNSDYFLCYIFIGLPNLHLTYI